MVTPLLWLAMYLSVGVLVLLACYHSSACRVSSRLERNRLIASFIGSTDVTAKPVAIAPKGVTASR
jgi:hypothetical protein